MARSGHLLYKDEFSNHPMFCVVIVAVVKLQTPEDKTKIRYKHRYESAETIIEIFHDTSKEILLLVYQLHIYEVYSSLKCSLQNQNLHTRQTW